MIRSISVQDVDGLSQSGLSWREHVPPDRLLWDIAATACVIVGTLGFFTTRNYAVAVVAVVLLIACVVMTRVWTSRERTLVFERNGKAVGPLGLPYASGTLLVSDWKRIGSIEVMGATYRDSVKAWGRELQNVGIVTTEGRTGYLARDLYPDEAREVAFRLTLALEEMKKETHKSAVLPGTADNGDLID